MYYSCKKFDNIGPGGSTGPRYKIAHNSTTAKAGEKICVDLGSLELSKYFDICLTKLKKKIKFYLIKIATNF
jgi:hypothetical protein